MRRQVSVRDQVPRREARNAISSRVGERERRVSVRERVVLRVYV